MFYVMLGRRIINLHRPGSFKKVLANMSLRIKLGLKKYRSGLNIIEQ